MRLKTMLGMSLLLTFAVASSAFADRMTACTMKYNLKGWSAIYKTASGSGMIRCDNGQKASVRISAKGGGLTAGRTDSSLTSAPSEALSRCKSARSRDGRVTKSDCTSDSVSPLTFAR